MADAIRWQDHGGIKEQVNECFMDDRPVYEWRLNRHVRSANSHVPVLPDARRPRWNAIVKTVSLR